MWICILLAHSIVRCMIMILFDIKSDVFYSINLTARVTWSVFVVTIININQVSNFVLTEIPCNTSRFNCFVRFFVFFVLKKIHTVPTEYDSIQVRQLDGFAYQGSINIEMSLLAQGLEEHFFIDSSEYSVLRQHISTAEADVIGRNGSSSAYFVLF
jgi:hypothetical protein